MNMVERVARAIAHADEQNGGLPYEYRIGVGKHAKEQLFDQARAAIEAMRDPTHSMTVAGHSALDDTEYTQTKALGSLMGRLAFVDIWRAMIDEALRK